MKNKNGGFLGVLILIYLVFLTGWVMNIVKLVKLDWNAPYKAEIIRSIGIPVAPLGGVVGYFNIKDN